MVPRKFNIVDFGGFDLANDFNTQLPGIYDKIVDAHWNCVYIMCFGLKFAEIDIAPQYMVPELHDGYITLNNSIRITRDDLIYIPELEPPPRPPVIEALLATENRIYTVPEGVDGFNPVEVAVPDNQNFVRYALSYSVAAYRGGLEYSGNVYGNSGMISALGLTLLGDFSQGASGQQNLLDSIANYSGVILQGIYNKNRTSNYNTSILYNHPVIGSQYWAGMKDRNTTYDTFVTFQSNTTVSLSGKQQVIIYGMK